MSSPRRTLRSATLVKLLALLSGAAHGEAAEPPPSRPRGTTTVLRRVDVVPMTGERVLRLRDVWIRGDRIDAILPAAERPPTTADLVVDADGRTLVPGLIDMHVHWILREPRLGLCLARGVTTIRIMEGEPRYLEWRSEVSRGDRVGPRLVVASPILDDEEGDRFVHVRTPEQARELARELHGTGYDLIKLLRLDWDVLEALLDEARELGLPVAGHVPNLTRGWRSVFSLGLRSIEHTAELVELAFPRGAKDAVTSGFLDAFVESGTAWSPLLVGTAVTNSMYEQGEAFLTDELVSRVLLYDGPDGVERLRGLIEEDQRADEATRRERLVDLEFLLRLVSAFDAAGGTVVVGTDSGGTVQVEGLAVHEELALLRRAGLSPHRALRAATVNAARMLGRTDLGIVAVGAVADLVLVDGSPLVDPTALANPVGVMVAGEWLDASRLRSLEEAAHVPAAGTAARPTPQP